MQSFQETTEINDLLVREKDVVWFSEYHSRYVAHAMAEWEKLCPLLIACTHSDWQRLTIWLLRMFYIYSLMSQRLQQMKLATCR